MSHPTRGDEPQYEVTLTLRVTTMVGFARGAGLPDHAEITPSDAIENAIGSGISGGEGSIESLLDYLGFELALPIEGEAVLL